MHTSCFIDACTVYCTVFIKKIKKYNKSKTKVYFQFILAQSYRGEGFVKQRNILYLGSHQMLEEDNNRAALLKYLRSKIHQSPLLIDTTPKDIKLLGDSLYQKYLIRYGLNEDGSVPEGMEMDKVMPSIPSKHLLADNHLVDLNKLEVYETKNFGNEHLCKQTMDKLGLLVKLEQLGMSSEKALRCCVAIVARAIYCSSEHKTAQILLQNSSLLECYDIQDPINHKQLYAVADSLYKHKEKIDKFLYDKVTDLFDLKDKLVIFDISNTYFETRKANSKIAKYGRSKEKRNDCPLVVFTGVINAEGFIRHSRIYEGNTPDSATLSEMIKDLEHYSPQSKSKTIVIDAGIADEENLELIKEKGYDYVCVSRKRLKDHPIEEATKKVYRTTDREKRKVALCLFEAVGHTDTWMYVQSDAKRLKEESMSKKLHERFIESLEEVKRALHKKNGTKKTIKVHERIGRKKEAHKRVSGQYTIRVITQEDKATNITWEKKNNKVNTDKEKGIYFIRTSHKNIEEGNLWDIYNTIREVESTFRCLKSDLNIQPIHHQNDGRVKSHIYLTILAYQVVNTIRHMLKQKGLNYDWRNITRIMSTQTIQTVKLNSDKQEIHMRAVSTPIKEVIEIYNATNSKSIIDKKKKSVVYH